MLAGIVNQDLGVSFLSDMLTRAITSDQKSKSYSFVSVVTSFARQFADDFAGILPRKHKAVYTKYNLKPPRTLVRKQYGGIIMYDMHFVFNGDELMMFADS